MFPTMGDRPHRTALTRTLPVGTRAWQARCKRLVGGRSRWVRREAGIPAAEDVRGGGPMLLRFAVERIADDQMDGNPATQPLLIKETTHAPEVTSVITDGGPILHPPAGAAMSEALFLSVAAQEGWTDASQVQVLLRYIAHQASPEAFGDFLDGERTEPCGDAFDARDPADDFLWAVVAELRNPGLTRDASFRGYCRNSRDLLTRCRRRCAGGGATPDWFQYHSD